MLRTTRSAVFVSGLLLVLSGLGVNAAGDVPAIGLAAAALGALLIVRSGIDRPLPLAVAIVLLWLAAQVVVVAVPTPVDWPMLAVAALVVLAAVGLLRSRGRSPGTPSARLR